MLSEKGIDIRQYKLLLDTQKIKKESYTAKEIRTRKYMQL
jgi:hypothetical protein